MTYGKEPFDLRLTMLCMCRRIPVILAGTILGTLLFGGGYYVKNVLLQGEPLYAAESIFRVEYAVEEEKDVGVVYINQMSWNTYLQSQFFLDAVWGHLEEMERTGADGLMPDREALGGMLEAVLASDLRVPSTTVTTNSPEKSVRIAKAVEAAMTQEFAREIREIISIEVIDSGSTAAEVIPDVRTARAFALSAVLSAFFMTVISLLQITGEDGVRLPCSIWKRYGVKTAGTLESRELEENIRYFFQDAPDKIMVCPVQAQVDGARVLEMLRERCPGLVRTQEEKTEQESGTEAAGSVERESAGQPMKSAKRESTGQAVWSAAPSPLACPEVCRQLREAGGILLVLKAGPHGGRQLERVLEYLRQQDCEVTAALLWEADERLIRWYYACSVHGRERTERKQA